LSDGALVKGLLVGWRRPNDTLDVAAKAPPPPAATENVLALDGGNEALASSSSLKRLDS